MLLLTPAGRGPAISSVGGTHVVIASNLLVADNLMNASGIVVLGSNDVMVQGNNARGFGQARPPPSTRRYPFVWRKGVLNGYSSTRVSLWDSLMFGRVSRWYSLMFGRVRYSSPSAPDHYR